MAPSGVMDAGIVNGLSNGPVLQKYSGSFIGIRTFLPNPSIQVTPDHQLKQIESPIDIPKRGEVLLHCKVTGICGSDIHFWKTGRIGSPVVSYDCVLGHEAAGIVLECGKGVDNLKPGDRVALEPGVPCGKCFLCVDGRYSLCESVQFSGVAPYHGTLQRYKVHPARWLHKLPDNVSLAEGALTEPLSVVLHAIERARITMGSGVPFCGAGPIGLIALAAARASGAHPTVITDLEPGRLEFAKNYVLSCQTYQVDRALNAESNACAPRKLFGDTEYSALRTVLECTGVESSVCIGVHTVRRGGTVVVIGVGNPVMNNLPFMHMSLAEIDLLFINRYRDTWPAGIACISGGILNLKPLVSHTFPLWRGIEALELRSDMTKGSIKVQIVDDEEA